MTEKVWKCTRADGSDFKTGTVNYADALAKGIAVEIEAESAEQAASKRSSSETVCGYGLHVSPTARKTIQFANRIYRPYRWFEGIVDVADIVERDEQKFRVRKFTPPTPPPTPLPPSASPGGDTDIYDGISALTMCCVVRRTGRSPVCREKVLGSH